MKEEAKRKGIGEGKRFSVLRKWENEGRVGHGKGRKRRRKRRVEREREEFEEYSV